MITSSLVTKDVTANPEKALAGPKKQDSPKPMNEKRVVRLDDVRDLDYAMMDRMGPRLEHMAM